MKASGAWYFSARKQNYRNDNDKLLSVLSLGFTFGFVFIVCAFYPGVSLNPALSVATSLQGLFFEWQTKVEWDCSGDSS